LHAAAKGILFLDEIGELGLNEQAMLLRALEEKTFLPFALIAKARATFN
jgi:transcriptional regulatory protein RtcR